MPEKKKYLDETGLSHLYLMLKEKFATKSEIEGINEILDNINGEAVENVNN